MSFWKKLKEIKVAAEAGYKTASGTFGEIKSTLTDTATKFSQNYREMSLDKELQDCQVAAKEGYNLAQANYDEIMATLTDAAQKLSQTDKEQNQVKRIRNTELVAKQKDELQQLVNKVKFIGEDIQTLREQSQYFSIVVYGRTTAGKSTLMEILTHGEGKSIGNGSQRTTRDMRIYEWNGLRIIDVPGTCSFGGEEDDKIAVKAAKSADLILFLLMNDAPQPDEAEKLAQLRKFGKPILGVVNIRKSFNDINSEICIEDLKDAMANTESIHATIKQFKEFAKNHNQDWSGIKFVATHLLSAYMAQGKSIKVFELSRFAEVENFILNKVRDDGRFLRIKTFVDAVAVPMNNTILKIYEQSGRTLLESDIWRDKCDQLGKWSETFLKRSQERFTNLYNQLLYKLNNAIDDFVNNNYENEKAGEHWQNYFTNLKLDKEYESLLKDLAKECERKRKALSDEMTKELSYSFGDKAQINIQLDSTTPVGKYAVIAVGAAASFVFAPLALVGILGGFLFDGKEKMIRENKKKLRDAITAPSHNILDKMHEQAWNKFNEEIWNKGICESWNLLKGYQFMLARLGKSQYDMANALFNKFNDLNRKLLKEAVSYKDVGSISSISAVARVPGETLVAFSNSSSLDIKKLSELLGEDFGVIKPPENGILMTSKFILGNEFNYDNYPLDFDTEEKKAECAYAVLPKNKLNVNSIKFKIAQQVASIPIIQR